ncbi:MAG: phytoene/squalene synthase family protein [Deltaproteobacteria bacterium]|nr:phytoene/squalene synthase family protein [Deltaproteobacteria bacterium]
MSRPEDDAIVAECRAIMAHHSKSFDFAARLLAPAVRDETAVVYAYLRRVDDAIDEAPASERPAALAALRQELDDVFGEGELPLVPNAFRVVARRRRIPRLYLEELLAGMAMDTEGHHYQADADLLRYCHRAAGVVGLTMCHVFGLRDDDALVPAVHLGWAMQLTNICRDVAEDWRLGRRYLPAERYEAFGVRAPEPDGGPFPARSIEATSVIVRDLLALADGYYESATTGLHALPWRASLAVSAASSIYRAIGDRIAAQGHDVTAGRAFVPTRAKVRLAARAVVSRVGWPDARPVRAPRRTLSFEQAWRGSARPRRPALER